MPHRRPPTDAEVAQAELLAARVRMRRGGYYAQRAPVSAPVLGCLLLVTVSVVAAVLMAALSPFWSRKAQAALAFVEEQERAERVHARWLEERHRIALNGGAETDDEAAALRRKADTERRRRLENAPPPAPGEVSREFLDAVGSGGRRVLAMRVMPHDDIDLDGLLEPCLSEELGVAAASLVSDLAVEFERATHADNPTVPLLVMPPPEQCTLQLRPVAEDAATDYIPPAVRDRWRARGVPPEVLDHELPRVLHLATLDPAMLARLQYVPTEADAAAVPLPADQRGALLPALRAWRAAPEPDDAAAEAYLRKALQLDTPSIELLRAHVADATRAPHERFRTMALDLFHLPPDAVAATNGIATPDGRIGALRVALPMTTLQGATGTAKLAQQVGFALKRMLGATGETKRLPPLVRPPARPFALSPNAPTTVAPASAPAASAHLTADTAAAALRDPQLVLEYWCDIGDRADGIVTLYVAWTTRHAAEQRRQAFKDYVGNRKDADTLGQGVLMVGSK